MPSHALTSLALTLGVLAAVGGCQGEPPSAKTPDPLPEKAIEMIDPKSMSDEQWRDKLTEQQYRIAREGGTERPFTGQYWDTTTTGVYRCICCGAELFKSTSKFDAGCGWPSFHSPADDANIATEPDSSHGMVRTEVTCSNCGAHLGHVFPDGPQPTGLRYCINSASLNLEPDEETGE